MAIFTDLQEAIRLSVIAALPDYPTTLVKFSHDNGPEPSASYVVINVLNTEQQGHHSTSTLVTTDETLTFQVAYEIMCQFSFIGSLSGEMSQSFNNNINNNPLTRLELSRNKLGFMRKSQIRRAPQKRDTKWVEYHNIDVTFSYIVSTEQSVDWIESVVMNSEETGQFTIPDITVAP